MKKLIFKNLEDQPNKKVLHYLNQHKNGKKALFIFDHGLGDLVDFLSLYETVKKEYPNWNFKIGYHHSLDYKCLHKDMYPLQGEDLNPYYIPPIGCSILLHSTVEQKYNFDNLLEKFNYIFIINYPEIPDNIKNNISNNSKVKYTKLDLCKVIEFGYQDNKELLTYVPPVNKSIEKNEQKVIFHVGGLTDKQLKNPDIEIQEIIWGEIIEAGFTPVDVHVNSTTNLTSSHLDIPSWMDEKLTHRNRNTPLEKILDEIYSSRYLIGICSDPLVCGTKLLGVENCLGLQYGINLKCYFPNELNIVDTKSYKRGTVKEWLTIKKEEGNN